MRSKLLRRFGHVAAGSLLAFAAVVGCTQAGPPTTVIFDMDTPRHQPATMGEDKRPIGTIEAAPGKFGGACRFSFAEGA